MWHILTRMRVALLVLILLVVGVALYLLPGRVPWVPGGTIVLAVKAIPTGSGSDIQFGIGLDDIVLLTDTGETVSTHLLPQRVLLTVDQTELTQLLSVRVPNGTYRGMSLRVRSPEIRSNWQDDAPPQAVALLYEEIHLPIPFTVAEDQTTAIIVGLETMQAIHPDDGRDVYLPVMQVETRTNAQVNDADGTPFTIESGTIAGSATYGMRWDGTVAQNVRAPYERPATGGSLQNEFASEHSEQRTSLDNPSDTPVQSVATTADETATGTDSVATSMEEEVATGTEETISDTDTEATP